jgi:predicted nucleic acid-binding protein
MVAANELNHFSQTYGFEKLHLGETECLYLCKQLKVPVLLTDDLDARKEAKAIGLTPVGSLGIVTKAFQLGVISLVDAEKYLLALDEISSLFVTGVIVRQAIEQLHNH